MSFRLSCHPALPFPHPVPLPFEFATQGNQVSYSDCFLRFAFLVWFFQFWQGFGWFTFCFAAAKRVLLLYTKHMLRICFFGFDALLPSRFHTRSICLVFVLLRQLLFCQILYSE